MKQKKPGAGKGKEEAKDKREGPQAFSFIPALGIHEPRQQFTKEGWEKVARG